MSMVLMLLLYATVFFGAGLLGYQLYKVLNKKIKSAQTGWALAGFSLLLFLCFALLAIGGLYLFIELYAFLAGREP